MSTHRSRGDPGKERGVGASPGKRPRLPVDHQPMSSDGAVSNSRSAAVPGQPGRVSHHYTSPGGSVFDLPVLWESETERDGQFRVQMKVLGGADGGSRRHYLERSLFSPVHEDDQGDHDLPTDGLAGVREPIPGRGTPGPRAGAVSLEPAGVR